MKKLKKNKTPELFPLDKIKPYPNNTKKHPQKQIDQVAASIKEFGFNQPLVLDKDDTIIVGHGRYEAAKALGLKEVPVIRPNLSPAQAKAYRLADNKLNESDWLMDAAISDLKELPAELFDLTGFDRDLLITADEKDDIVPENVPVRSKLGDLYQLGDHRVLCGDSTKKEEVEKLMDGKKADMVFIDPPYGVSYADKNKYLNKIARGNRIQTQIEGDHLSVEKTASDIIYPAFCNVKEILAKQASYYITAPQGGELLMMMMMMMQKSGIPLRHMLIWKKNNHVLGRTDYNYKHEPILYGWINKHNFYGGGEQRFSVWDFDKPLRSNLHPTMKPVALIINAILNSTQSKNNVVADLFLGSGSTLIACEKTGRVCYAMEIDPHYTDVIVQRYVDFTGNTKVVKNGKIIEWPISQKTPRKSPTKD